MPSRKTNITVDVAKASQMINDLRSVYSRDKFNTMMGDVFKRSRGRTRVIISQEVPKYYRVKRKRPLTKMVGNPRIEKSGGNVSCSIPLDGIRGKISGEQEMYKSTAPVKQMWKTRSGGKSKRNVYKVRAYIVRGHSSELPNEGKRVHFKVFTGKFKGWTFVRHDKKGEHITRAVGDAPPQMPMNRAEERVKKELAEFFVNRIAHHHDQMLKNLGAK